MGCHGPVRKEDEWAWGFGELPARPGLTEYIYINVRVQERLDLDHIAAREDGGFLGIDSASRLAGGRQEGWSCNHTKSGRVGK